MGHCVGLKAAKSLRHPRRMSPIPVLHRYSVHKRVLVYTSVITSVYTVSVTTTHIFFVGSIPELEPTFSHHSPEREEAQALESGLLVWSLNPLCSVPNLLFVPTESNNKYVPVTRGCIVSCLCDFNK